VPIVSVLAVVPVAAGAAGVVLASDRVEANVGVVSVVAVPLPLPEVSVDAVVPLPPVVVASLVDVDGAMKFMLLSDEPADTLSDVIAAALSLADEPAAEGAEPEPAVTLKVFVPLLDSSHGRPDADAPPFRLASMTYRFRSVESTAHCPGGSPGVPAG
jgi:hypothetical protein